MGKKQVRKWNPKTWKDRLQKNWKTFEFFERCDVIYGIAQRIGFSSAEEAWDENPWVQGSVDPADLSIVVWPEQYLHVLECKSGWVWYWPMRGNSSLDLATQLRKWVKEEFCGELFLEPPLQPKLEGDYYGKIMTDGRPPDSVICWTGAGFWLTDDLIGLRQDVLERNSKRK